MEDLMHHRYHTRPFPSNLAETCELGDLNLKDCTCAHFIDDSTPYEVLKKYVPEHEEHQAPVDSYQMFPKSSSYHRLGFYSRSEDSRAEQLKRKMMSRRVDVGLRAGIGMHRVKFENENIWVLFQEVDYMDRKQSSVVVFGKGRERGPLLQKFIEHVLKWGQGEPEPSKIDIYSYSVRHGDWMRSLCKVSRPLASVFLPKETKDLIVKDLESYLSEEAEKWYQKHGIPYKRMYLLYGTPGAGKTSLIQALAGHFYMNVCFIQPTTDKFDDSQLQEALRTAPANSIIVLEDIDALFSKNRESGADNKGSLSFSGLLNGLDGISTPQGQVFMMTTNYIDKLDPALIRDGRVDLRLEFPKATSECIKAMFHSFYPTLEPFKPKTQIEEEKNEEDVVSLDDKAKLTKLAEDFDGMWHTRFPDGVAMATIQQHFIMQRRSTAAECVDGVKDARVWNPEQKAKSTEED